MAQLEHSLLAQLHWSSVCLRVCYRTIPRISPFVKMADNGPEVQYIAPLNQPLEPNAVNQPPLEAPQALPGQQAVVEEPNQAPVGELEVRRFIINCIILFYYKFFIPR